MRRGVFIVTVLAAAVAVSGCLLKRSPASRTYVLDPTVVRSAGAPSGPAVAVMGVAKVLVPDWLDRPHVLARAANGEIVSDDFSRWGEPLPRGIQRVLIENLAALLPERRILAEPISPRLTVDYRVEVTVVDMTSAGDGTVLVDTRWDVIGGKGEVMVRRRSSDRGRAAAPGAPGVVAGVNDALATLSREIADVIRMLPRPPTATPGPRAAGSVRTPA
ncbi:MAG: PqiC family protein [Vicinamibacterales bacterium]|nr:PqiC family protein [Vicinamibacterales bacterium]